MRRERRNAACVLMTVVACWSLAAAGGCTLRRTGTNGNVGFQFTPPPDHPEVLAAATEITPLKICVLKVDVKWVGPAQGGGYSGQTVWTYSSTDGQFKIEANTASQAIASQSLQLWENAIQSQISELLEERATALGKTIHLVSRNELDAYLRERDLKLADIVDGDSLSDKARLLDIDLYLLGDIDGQTTVRQAQKSSIWGKIAGFFLGGYFGHEMGRPKRQVARTITFAGHLKAQDAKTAKVWLLHDITTQKIEDKKPHFWEDDQDVIDLIPEEQVIKDKLDFQVHSFVGRMLPTPQNIRYTVRSSRNADSVEGVRWQELGNDTKALEAFERAIVTNPRDHRSLFGAGVACERMGELGKAATYYEQAHVNSSGKTDENGEGQYRLAHERVTQRRKVEGDQPRAM